MKLIARVISGEARVKDLFLPDYLMIKEMTMRLMMMCVIQVTVLRSGVK